MTSFIAILLVATSPPQHVVMPNPRTFAAQAFVWRLAFPGFCLFREMEFRQFQVSAGEFRAHESLSSSVPWEFQPSNSIASLRRLLGSRNRNQRLLALCVLYPDARQIECISVYLNADKLAAPSLTHDTPVVLAPMCESRTTSPMRE